MQLNGCFIGHVNAAYFLDKLEDLQSDFMIRMLTIVSVMCFTETYPVPGACIDSFLMKHFPCHNTFYIVKWGNESLRNNGAYLV